MASQSKRGTKDEKNGDRPALPFEPGRDRKKTAKSSAKADQPKANKQADPAASNQDSKSDKSGSGISARAQARVDEIRASNRKKAAAKASADPQQADSQQARSSKNRSSAADSKGAIPAAVSKRMLRRMAVLSLSPIALGVSIFFASYYLLSQEIVEFAPVVVLLTTMGCFGLGVVGLSYGMLSASWDEEPGSLVGMSEFKLNLGRMTEAWKESRQSKT